ncbi:EI24 domain-containing protein [Ruegeria pomeroyi]|uniref:EI24 domain-containing protein n=1 Tax=Ruegeria pomeroyi TaxID=89184 RepID=A0A850LII9_9RHOB|nr:EI24 domain-containing protein [Ruegeria pomeroyi]NVK97733.1 EI24 domain-containing protein [Ruegeria pomeroyi]NVL00384.1 EI24 domain-containing protein [Ruegeria pomeroyi]QWV11038.1 EI24 domain-containing protein [Ruegeria pomeroyi]
MIINAFLAALGQIGDPRFRKVLGLGVGLTLALLVAVYALFLWLIQTLVGPEVTLPVLGEVTWVGGLLSVSSLIFMLVLSVFLMVPVASAITSMFLDEVAQAVEDRHYPHLPAVAKVPFGEALKDTVNFLGVLIAANLAAFVLYAMFAPFALFIFWGLNGFLLGREYFTLAAMRRVGRAEARRLRSKHLMTIWAAGALMAIPLSVPLVNLLIPILGAATFTHIFHAVNGIR